jgi:cytidylate kinase
MPDLPEIKLPPDDVKVIDEILSGKDRHRAIVARRAGISREDLARGVVRYVLSADYRYDLVKVLTTLGLDADEVIQAAEEVAYAFGQSPVVERLLEQAGAELAASKLVRIRNLVQAGKQQLAWAPLDQLIRAYPETAATKEAKELKAKLQADEETAAAPELDLIKDLAAGHTGTPLHGFQGDRGVLPRAPGWPVSLTVAVSREAGSRGGSIGRRAGRKLGWQVYNQELLEYVAHEGPLRQAIIEPLAPAASSWLEQRLREVLREQNLSQHPSITELVRIVLALGLQGEVVLIGRGAGCILPAESTLNVRIIAPRADRIAYMSQWLRLAGDQAAEQVDLRDTRRAEFISTHFLRQAADIYRYDLVLNSSLLGGELCADLIVQAARAKLAAYRQSQQSEPPDLRE